MRWFVRIDALSDYSVIGNTSDFDSDISGSSPDSLTILRSLLNAVNNSSSWLK